MALLCLQCPSTPRASAQLQLWGFWFQLPGAARLLQNEGSVFLALLLSPVWQMSGGLRKKEEEP